MKRSRFLLLLILFTGLNLALIRALPPSFSGQEMSAQDKKMMDQMMKYGTPGSEHEFLRSYAGDWDVDVTTWPQPGAPPQMSKATMKNTLIFGGRYLESHYEGTMGGTAYTGLEVIGFDRFKKMFTTFWIDSMSSGFMVTSGTLDESGQVLTETGLVPDAMTDGKTMRKVKNVTTFMGPGNYRFEMFMTMPGGTEAKGMELVCKRK